MDPRVTRRRVLGGVTLSSLAALAGCTGSAGPAGEGANDGSSGAERTDTSSTERTASGESSTGERATRADAPTPETPEAAVRGFLEASTRTDDPAVIGSYFHPLHPLDPDDVDGEAVRSRYPRDVERSNVDVDPVDQEVTAEMVLSAPLLRTADVEETEVREALTSGESALRRVEITRSSGDTREYHVVAVETADRWRILARGVDADRADALEAYAVDDVALDPDGERARVEFVPSPRADSVEITATGTSSTRRTGDPGSRGHLAVGVDPDGDEVVVTATVDGEERTIHRERLPESARAVDEVAFDDDPGGELLDAAAVVTFTGDQRGETLAIESTVAGGSTSFDTAETATSGTVPVDPDGDEVVVTVTGDGTTTEVHRERYYPG
jgi:hypothetical protein